MADLKSISGIRDNCQQARDANDFELVIWLVITSQDQSDQSDPTDQPKGDTP